MTAAQGTSIAVNPDEESRRRRDAGRFRARSCYWLAALLGVLAGTFLPALVPTLPLGCLGIAALLAAHYFEASAFREPGRSGGRALSHIDDLTGLPNRRAFLEQLKACLDKPLGQDEFSAVFFMDLDRFKAINDSFGHTVGDQFLLAICHRLQNRLSSGAMLARMGGDEFTILVNNVKGREQVLKLAEKLMSVFNDPVKLRSRELWANASMGIVMAGMPRPKADELLNMADTALYQAKAQGKGRFVLFEPNLPRPSMHWPTLDGDLQTAVSRNELVLHFQPVVDLSSMRIAGFEALIRWNHPRLGLLAPNDFIPIAEETGVIRSLGAWVIENACEHASALQSLFGESLTMSINLSALQFGQPDMLTHIISSVRRTGLQPRSVQFEITESVLMRDDEQTARNLLELRNLGFLVAIDDFGAGYASLGYLKQFEVDAIKIDKSFVSDLRYPRNAALARSTIQLGHSLGMVVVAEGIETEQQRGFLVKAGCDLGQGYLLGRPMDEKQLNERLSVYGLECGLALPQETTSGHQVGVRYTHAA